MKWPYVYNQLKYLAIMAMYGVSEKQTIWPCMYNGMLSQRLLHHTYTCWMTMRSTLDDCSFLANSNRTTAFYNVDSAVRLLNDRSTSSTASWMFIWNIKLKKKKIAGCTDWTRLLIPEETRAIALGNFSLLHELISNLLTRNLRGNVRTWVIKTWT